MTNYEFFEEFIKSILYEATICEVHDAVLGSKCDEDCKNCFDKLFKWLNQEFKEPIKLTRTEYHILKGLDGMFKWIARDSADYVLSVHADKPTKHSDCWGYRLGRSHGLAVFNHLFQFIKWEDDEPYLIDDLLKCVVVEDE